MPGCKANSASIDKLYDNPQTDDRIIYDCGSYFYDTVLTVSGNTVTSRRTDDLEERYMRSIEAVLAGTESDLASIPAPSEKVETIEEFRNRLITTLDDVSAVILANRDHETEIDAGKIDELYENPTPGDRMVYNLIYGGDLRFERTITRNGDIIGFEESEKRYTIGRFRNAMIKAIEEKRLMAVSLAIRQTKHNGKTAYPDMARISAFAKQIYEFEPGTKKAVDNGTITMRELEIAHYINAWINENIPDNGIETENHERALISKLQDAYLIASEIFGISDYDAQMIFEKVSDIKRSA